MAGFSPYQQELLFAVETTPGTAVTAGLIRDGCRTIAQADNRQTEDIMEYTGSATSHVGNEETQHNGGMTVSGVARLSGAFAYFLGSMGGSGSEATTGASDPFTHTWTPVTTSTACKTFTTYENDGDTANVLQRAQSTLSQLHLAVTPSGVMSYDATFSSLFPVTVARSGLTVATYIGSSTGTKKTPIKNFQGAYTFYNSAGTAYTAKIIGADLTFSRAVELVPNAQGLNPSDIALGELMFEGSITFIFDGAGAGTVYADYLANSELGDATHVHSAVWTDADTHSLTVNFYPVKWTNVTLDKSGQRIKATATLMTYQDFAKVNQAAAIYTAPKSIVITNGVTANMVG